MPFLFSRVIRCVESVAWGFIMRRQWWYASYLIYRNTCSPFFDRLRWNNGAHFWHRPTDKFLSTKRHHILTFISQWIWSRIRRFSLCWFIQSALRIHSSDFHLNFRLPFFIETVRSFISTAFHLLRMAFHRGFHGQTYIAWWKQQGKISESKSMPT